MTTALVIGSGVAATAAAFALAERHVRVTLVRGAPAASELAPGVFDVGAIGETGAPVRGDVATFLARLGEIDIGPCLVATSAGVAREGAARDRALLDLASLSAGEVFVPTLLRDGWDGAALAWMLAASPKAEARGLRFRAVDASLLRLADERTVAPRVLAARHDDEARLAWLADRLLAAERGIGRPAAWLLPPLLGAAGEQASALATRIARPVGEIADTLAGSAGARFAARRDRLLAALGVTPAAGFVTALREDDAGVTASLDEERSVRADVAVLATGRLIGGGLCYTPSDAAAGREVPTEGRPFLRESLRVARVGEGGLPLAVPGSLFGVPPEALAWPFVKHGGLERVGVLSEAGRVEGRARIFAAGDVLADRPRTWLDAAATGLAAGASAATCAAAEGRARSSG